MTSFDLENRNRNEIQNNYIPNVINDSEKTIL